MKAPPARTPDNLTELLRRWSSGDAAALEQLVPLVDRDLRRVARRYLRHERGTPTLDRTTVLINETYTSFLLQKSIHWADRAHFFGIAARLMRQILVDHARRSRAIKRGGAERAGPSADVSAEKIAGDEGLGAVELIAVHHALERLAELDARQARVVELRFFGGLTIEETSKLLAVSLDTVKRDWRKARLWLRREVRGDGIGES